VTDESPAARRPRGSFVLYAVAFALVVVSAVAVAVAARGFLASLTTLWFSVVLSVAAIGFAVASVVVPRRR
jgi:heme/copper-type cytochrome/quinol oxidase subunit 4